MIDDAPDLAGALLHDEALEDIPGLVHGALGRPAVDAVARADIARRLGFPALVTPKQVHGAAVHHVRGPDCVGTPCDALLLDRPGLLGGVLGADCPGVLVVDPGGRRLALVHSGWRGTAERIVVRALEALIALGAEPSQVRAWIGPGISGRSYEVDEPVLEALARTVDAAAYDRAVTPTRPGHAGVDLGVLLESQLLAAGLAPDHLSRAPICTYTDPAWHSFRRDGPRSGRHLLLAGWRE